MSKKKIKLVIEGREDAERILAEYRDFKLNLDDQMIMVNQAKADIEKRHAPEIAILLERCDERWDALENWLEKNPDLMPKDKRSLEFSAGTIGYQLGKWTVMALKGMNLKKALAIIEKKARIFPTLKRYLSVKTELDRENLIKDRDKFKERTLRRFGLAITRQDRFYVDLKVEEPAVAKREAA